MVHHSQFFKSLEIRYHSGIERIYFDNFHLTFWHYNAFKDGIRPSDQGVSGLATWLAVNRLMPFQRTVWGKATAQVLYS